MTRFASYGRSAHMMVCVIACLVACGCQSAPRNFDAISAYYRYDFTTAREALRRNAELKNDEQVILNNVRLGMASLADGDVREAERALGRSFDFLSTAGLNKDRTIAAVLDHEGVRIWKGEPFEQALTYYYVSALYALMGDWENVRAAAGNSLFRLTDFGADQNAENLARNAARDPDYLARGYTAVDTNFALGFLMQAIGSDLSGSSQAAGEQFDAAVKINPGLKDMTNILRRREYDTLLIIDYGKGPTKISFGPDQALARFEPQERAHGPVIVSKGVTPLARVNIVCDVNQMAVDHRWNNLEDIRRAKSVIGNVLTYGGLGAAAYGAHRRDTTVALAGLAAVGAGLLTKAGAKADTRYCEFMPQAIYLVPLNLRQPTDLRIAIEGDAGSTLILDDVQPGRPGSPTAAYLRIHGPDSPRPDWLTRRNSLYGNDATGVRPGDYPWILGGQDLSTPTRETLRAYQANGYLRDFTLSDLQNLYRAEDILIGSGTEDRPGMLKNPSFRHILEGGTGLFTPLPTSLGYKRLMCATHPPYQPKSALAKSHFIGNGSLASRVNAQENDPWNAVDFDDRSPLDH